MTPEEFEKSIDTSEEAKVCPITRRDCIESRCGWYYNLTCSCALPAIADRLDLLSDLAVEV
ncbi:MAG: hypothetical protein ACLRH1_09445 [Acutalibacteraceae bacterium]